MNITVHIERLILDGLPVTSGQGPLVQAAVEAEFTRLVGEHGLSLLRTAAVPRVSGGAIQFMEGGKPGQFGCQIARAIYGGLSQTPAPPRPTPLGRGGRK